MFTQLKKYHITDFLLLLSLITLIFPEHWNSKALIVSLIYVLICFYKNFAFSIPRLTYLYIPLTASVALSILWSEDRELSSLGAVSMLPFLLYGIGYKQLFSFKSLDKIISITALTYIVIGLIGIILAFLRFQESGLISNFFYHEFTQPLDANAIYIAMIGAQIYLFIIYRLIFKNAENKLLDVFILLILFGLLVLLSSKLILVFIVLISFVFLIRSFYKNGYNKKRMGIIIFFTISITILLASSTFTKDRFTKILKSDQIIEVFEKQHFGYIYNWNGLTLRLFQWRCFYEIEQEDNFNSYLGTGFNASQTYLNQKYKQYDLYAGTGNDNNDIGYYAYNFHNQYLQLIIELGVLGILSIVLMVYAFIVFPIKSKNLLLFGVGSLFIVFAFTESYLLRQKGIVSFVLFPLLAHFYKQNEPQK